MAVFDVKKNFAYSLVATAPSPASSGTSLVVTGGTGTLFPTVPFNAVIWPIGTQPTAANAEVVRVTNRSTDTLTITRAQESSVARTVIVGDQIAVNITAKALTDIEGFFPTMAALMNPIGEIKMWPTTTAPTNWGLCNGQAISRATYATLFALIGTTFGAGDGSTTFNLPDMQQRIPIGKTAAGGLSTIGTTTGSWDHTHGPGTLQVSSHDHSSGTLTVASHTHGAGSLQVASHSHGPGTLAVASHTHDDGSLAADSDGSHTHTGTTSEHAGHTHGLSVAGSELSGDQDSFSFVEASETGSGGIHTHTFTTDSGGSHTHGISGSTGSAAPAVSSGTTATTAPMVDSGVTGATAPAVTGGTTGAAAPLLGGGLSGTANPPVLVLNFIMLLTHSGLA